MIRSFHSWHRTYFYCHCTVLVFCWGGWRPKTRTSRRCSSSTIYMCSKNDRRVRYYFFGGVFAHNVALVSFGFHPFRQQRWLSFLTFGVPYLHQYVCVGDLDRVRQQYVVGNACSDSNVSFWFWSVIFDCVWNNILCFGSLLSPFVRFSTHTNFIFKTNCFVFAQHRDHQHSSLIDSKTK